MTKHIFSILALVAILIMSVAIDVSAQGLTVRTSAGELPSAEPMSLAGAEAIESPWLADPTLVCMRFEQKRDLHSPKRLVLDQSIQELKWAATHGPRRELLEAFLDRQAGPDTSGNTLRMARVGGSLDSWSEIRAEQQAPRTELFSLGGLDVNLIGPDSIGR